MGNAIEFEGNEHLEVCIRDLEVIEQEEPLSHRRLDISVETKLSLQARYLYGFIFFISNLFAWFARDYGHKLLSEIHYLRACRSGDEWFHAEGVLRVSFSCFIFFLFMFATTYRAGKLHEIRNSWHSSWWPLKFVLWIIFMIVPVVIPVAFIQIYGEIARVGAGVFLVLQLISIIQFLTWCNNYFLTDSLSRLRCFLGLFLSTIFYIASICGIILMYLLYARGRGASCTLNIFFITWTAILVKVMMVVSLHSKVNTGLLSSGIMGSYVIFLCWSAIRSEPPTGKHSSNNQVSDSGDWVTGLSFLLAICAIVLATFSTGIDSESFQFRRDNVLSEDDVPYNYAFFHCIFSIGAMYFAMLFTGWELGHPTRKWSIDVGWASTWVKIINQWFAATLYIWTLISPALRRDKVINREESVQNVHTSA